MKVILSLVFTSFITFSIMAQKAPPVYKLEAKQNGGLAYTFKLEDGVPLTDLSWAWSSQNACFVEIRKEFFEGNHLHFQTQIEKYSTMVIRLIPDDKKSNMSLYAYSGGHGALPPKLSSCVSCEADFHQEKPSVNRPRPDHTRTVELRAVNRPYPVTIGVAGAKGVTNGGFTLEIHMKRNR